MVIENGPRDAESATVAGSTVADDNEVSAIFAATGGRGQIFAPLRRFLY